MTDSPIFDWNCVQVSPNACTTLILSPNDEKTLETCRARFLNILNFKTPDPVIPPALPPAATASALPLRALRHSHGAQVGLRHTIDANQTQMFVTE